MGSKRYQIDLTEVELHALQRAIAIAFAVSGKLGRRGVLFRPLGKPLSGPNPTEKSAARRVERKVWEAELGWAADGKLLGEMAERVNKATDSAYTAEDLRDLWCDEGHQCRACGESFTDAEIKGKDACPECKEDELVSGIFVPLLGGGTTFVSFP